MSGIGREGGRRRRRHRGNVTPKREEPVKEARPPVRADDWSKNKRIKNAVLYDRPRWTPPKLNTDPLPEPDCAWCGKPIRDMDAAVRDRDSGRPVHFDCIIVRLGETEKLGKDDMIAYIGGGRFGVVHFTENRESRSRLVLQEPVPGRVFTIKKIFEWEDKNDRAGWRSSIADHYSIT